FFSKAEGSGKRVLEVVDVDGGPARPLTKPLGDDNYPDPTPDGKSLVFCRTLGGGKSSVAILPLGGGEARALFDGEASSARAGDGIVATHQKNDHEVVLLEGVFR